MSEHPIFYRLQDHDICIYIHLSPNISRIYIYMYMYMEPHTHIYKYTVYTYKNINIIPHIYICINIIYIIYTHQDLMYTDYIYTYTHIRCFSLVGVPSSPRVPATAAAVEIPAKLAEFGFLELTPEWLDPGFLWWGKMGFLIDKKYGLMDL